MKDCLPAFGISTAPIFSSASGLIEEEVNDSIEFNERLSDKDLESEDLAASLNN